MIAMVTTTNTVHRIMVTIITAMPPDAPHPAQAVKWSLLQLSVASRLALVAVVSGAMWAVVVGAMR